MLTVTPGAEAGDAVASGREREGVEIILVVGSTGDLGRSIVTRLVEDGQQVRCLVRAGSDRAALPTGVEWFVYVSYAGVDLGTGMPLERAKAGTERRLTASRMRPVIVRPEAFPRSSQLWRRAGPPRRSRSADPRH